MTATNQPRSGYTLPVFACAAALAAYRCLLETSPETVTIDLLDPPQKVTIPIEQAAKLNDYQALAITRSDPGDNLDLTRNTPIWAIVERLTTAKTPVTIVGGEGVGRLVDYDNKAAIYSYAQRLLTVNLVSQLISPTEYIQVTIIIPEGRKLAERTSNEAFGVVEGLSLLGTTGISQPLSAPAQLEVYHQELLQKASEFDSLVFCVGENGLDLAAKMGINPQQMIKTANWLGPMLAAAGLTSLKSLLLFGYHGKLIKLAGGIFHTHHDLADGRLEILTSNLAVLDPPSRIIKTVFASQTTEEALTYLRQEDIQNNSNWVDQVYEAIASSIDERSQAYIKKQSNNDQLKVGCLLFDRQRQVIISSTQGQKIISNLIVQ
ncbi:MAG: cobalt-precorrin-5B (C(1))-methyltransferase [Gloeocapsa sp. DLM2.Bin57]|nr:MAG: cobalt-precorrin-5B (C(1))-methyltransferase [Gloeocapsa sp. DLM2.Bin57]